MIDYEREGIAQEDAEKMEDVLWAISGSPYGVIDTEPDSEEEGIARALSTNIFAPFPVAAPKRMLGTCELWNQFNELKVFLEEKYGRYDFIPTQFHFDAMHHVRSCPACALRWMKVYEERNYFLRPRQEYQEDNYEEEE